MRLRKAMPADQPLLEVWDSRPHIVAVSGSDGPWDWSTELARDVAWQEMLIAEDDHGRPFGFLQILDPAGDEAGYWGDVPDGVRAIDIWIGEEDAIGRGYGGAMMRESLVRCFAVPRVTGVLIDPLYSNAAARGFYEHMGFRFVGRRRFGDDDCAVYRLDRHD